MNDYQIGEIVDITIKGVRVVRPPSATGTTGVTIVDERNAAWHMPPQADVTRVAPVEWPPRKDDLWADRDGDRWLGVLVDNDDTTGEEYVALMPSRASKSQAYPDEEQLLHRYGPFHLVTRTERDGDA